MRHRDKINKLGRTSSHRKATLKNLAINLILHKRIKTTLAKAKELRKFIEPIITKVKKQTMHSMRYAFKKLNNKEALKELMKTIVPAVKNRPGGYTRIFKLGFRRGDNTQLALIELVDFNPVGYSKEVKKLKKKKVRRGKGKKKSKAPEEIKEGEMQTTETKEESHKESSSEAKLEKETPQEIKPQQ